MPTWLIFILEIIAFAIIILFVYNLLKIYVLSKININKWIVLACAIATLLISPVLEVNGIKITGTFWQYIPTAIFAIFFLWFMDIVNNRRYEAKDKKNKVVIKPKAKPNRVKNNKKDK